MTLRTIRRGNRTTAFGNQDLLPSSCHFWQFEADGNAVTLVDIMTSPEEPDRTMKPHPGAHTEKLPVRQDSGRHPMVIVQQRIPADGAEMFS